MHWTRWVTASHPVRHPLEVLARTRLVAERPDDHRRMILVPLDGPLHPVQTGLKPAWIIARISLPVTELEPVRLVITLLDHPESELVGKIKYSRMRWIVAGPDGIDTCSLHHDQICAGVLLVEHPTPNRVGLMPIHSAEDHLTAIDAQDVAINLDPAKAESDAHRLAHRPDLGLIQLGYFRSPRIHLAYRERRHVVGAADALPDAELGNRDLHWESALGRDDLRIDRSLAVQGVLGPKPKIIN